MTQSSKNRVYVPPSARETWTSYLENNLRSSDPAILCLHDISERRLHPPDEDVDIYSNGFLTGPTWPENDGVNILGTLLGSPALVEEYLHKKLEKHKLLLPFIVDVEEMFFSREAQRMLTGSTIPRLTHILKSVPKDHALTKWMRSADDAHLSTWLRSVGAEQLDATLPALERAHLAASMELPPQFGGYKLCNYSGNLRCWVAIPYTRCR